MKVLVIGATGMIGRRVVPLRLEEGHEVTAAGWRHARPVAAPVQPGAADRYGVAAGDPSGREGWHAAVESIASSVSF